MRKKKAIPVDIVYIPVVADEITSKSIPNKDGTKAIMSNTYAIAK